MPEIDRIACHEAGHAVVQTLLGRGWFEVAEVSIAAETCNAGDEQLVKGRTLLGAEANLNLYEFVLATFAGIAAENRYFEDHPPTGDDRLWGAVGDIDEWDCACRRLYPDAAQARLVGLNVMRKLREIFDDPVVWRVVRELAMTLVAQETVTGDELRRLLAGLTEVNIVSRRGSHRTD